MIIQADQSSSTRARRREGRKASKDSHNNPIKEVGQARSTAEGHNRGRIEVRRTTNNREGLGREAVPEDHLEKSNVDYYS